MKGMRDGNRLLAAARSSCRLAPIGFHSVNRASLGHEQQIKILDFGRVLLDNRDFSFVGVTGNGAK